MRRPKLPWTPVDGYTLTWWELGPYDDKAIRYRLRYDLRTDTWETLPGSRDADERHYKGWDRPETLNWKRVYETRKQVVAAGTKKLRKQIEYLKKRIRRLNK